MVPDNTVSYNITDNEIPKSDISYQLEIDQSETHGSVSEEILKYENFQHAESVCLTNNTDTPSYISDSDDTISETESVDLDSSLSSLSDDDRNSNINDQTKENDTSRQDELNMALLSFILKHKLSGSAVSDLLDLLHIYNVGHIDGLNLINLKQIVGTCEANVIDVCDICGTLFPEDENIFTCSQDGCSGLRYKGPRSTQHFKRRKSYFARLPVIHQLKDILEKNGTWQSLNQYRNECDKNKNISDIINAEAYRELRKPGKCCQMTTIFLCYSILMVFLCTNHHVSVFGQYILSSISFLQ